MGDIAADPTSMPGVDALDAKPPRTSTSDNYLAPSRSLPLLSRAEIASRIASSHRLLVVHTDLVLDLSAFAASHPGGELAVLHFVGRDAGDEIDAYHSDEVRRRMRSFVVGRLELEGGVGWRPLTPPIALGLVADKTSPTGWRREGRLRLAEEVASGQEKAAASSASPSSPPTLSPADIEPPAQSTLSLAKETARSRAYRRLRSKLQAAGMFTPPGWVAGYGGDIVRYALLAGMAGWFYFKSTGWAGYMVSAVCLGAFWHQLTFLVHDAGHTGVSGNHRADYILAIALADWVGGLSVGWWKDNHNIHHLVTNHVEHDPDIQHIPFFAISPKFFGSMWSTYYKRVMEFDAFSKVMIGVQHQIYYIVLSLARFNLYANSYVWLATKAKRTAYWRAEVAGVAFFWVWFGALLKNLPGWKVRVAYLLVSHIVTSPVHVQIVLSHFARSTEDLGPTESFVSRQLRTTMDVICDPSIEFLHGGLHLQVTHHLFPRIPRHNLRKASLLVKDFCKEQDLEYAEYHFVEGNQRVLSTLKSVADQLQLLHKIAAADAAAAPQDRIIE